jgi:hypothetical protein
MIHSKQFAPLRNWTLWALVNELSLLEVTESAR